MYSLRKRAKLIESGEIGVDSESLNSLPNELKLMIFDYLGVKDLLNLRLVNMNLKNLVDNYSRVWRNVRIKVNFGVEEKTTSKKSTIENDLSTFRKFISRVESRETIVINCEKHFGHKLIKSTEKEEPEIKRKQQQQQRRRQLHSMCLINPNRESVISYLELISNYCQKLKIDWFYYSNITLKPIERLVVLNHVYCLDISDANPILNYIDEIFPNLKHLHIRIGSTSILTLHTIFSHLTSIKLIEIKSFNGLESMFQAPNNLSSNKLKIKTVIFNYLNLKCIELLLTNVFDVTGLENLELELNWSDPDPDCDSRKFLSFLFDYLSTSYLKCLRINIFEKNYEPSGVEFELICKLFSRARSVYLSIISSSSLASSALHCDMEVRFHEESDKLLSYCYRLPNQFEEINFLADNNQGLDENQQRIVKNLVKLSSYWSSGEATVYF